MDVLALGERIATEGGVAKYLQNRGYEPFFEESPSHKWRLGMVNKGLNLEWRGEWYSMRKEAIMHFDINVILLVYEIARKEAEEGTLVE